MPVASLIEIAGDIVNSADDFVDGLKKYLQTGEWPATGAFYGKAGDFATLLSYLKDSPILGIGAAALSYKALLVDADNVATAHVNGDKHAEISSFLSMIVDLANMAAVIPAIKPEAVAISITVTAIKEIYESHDDIVALAENLENAFTTYGVDIDAIQYDQMGNAISSGTSASGGMVVPSQSNSVVLIANTPNSTLLIRH